MLPLNPLIFILLNKRKDTREIKSGYLAWTIHEKTAMSIFCFNFKDTHALEENDK